MGDIETNKNTVYMVEIRSVWGDPKSGMRTLTTESHAEAERALLCDRMAEEFGSGTTAADMRGFMQVIEDAKDPERLLVLLHDYVNPWRRGNEDDAGPVEVEKAGKRAGDRDKATWRPTFRYYDDPKDGRPFTLVEEDRGNVYHDTLWRYRLDFYASAPKSVHLRREFASKEGE